MVVRSGVVIMVVAMVGACVVGACVVGGGVEVAGGVVMGAVVVTVMQLPAHTHVGGHALGDMYEAQGSVR